MWGSVGVEVARGMFTAMGGAMAHHPSLSFPRKHDVRGDLLCTEFWEEHWVPPAGNHLGGYESGQKA